LRIAMRWCPSEAVTSTVVFGRLVSRVCAYRHLFHSISLVRLYD
jgi:hypothetical protein